MAYRYVAYTPQKRVVRGTLSVASKSAAVETLERAGVKILSLRQVRRWSIEELLPTLFRVKVQDVILFSRQLAMLLERGTGFLTALRLARDQTTNKVFRRTLADIVKDVEAGKTFCDALTKHPQAFPLTYSRTVRVGEQTGKLEIALREAANHMEQDETTRKRIRSALTYPVFVVLLGVGSAVVLVTTVLPPLMRVLAEFNTELPWPTRLILGLASFISDYKFYLLGVVLLLVALLLWAANRSSRRYQLERLVMKSPMIGRVVLVRNLSQFTRVTSILLGAGLPIIEVISATRQSVQSEVVRRALDEIPKSILQGQSLSQAMKASRLFPSMLVQMVTTGEETNTLDSSFAALADHYEFEFNQTLNMLISMLEPLLVTLIGLIVGIVAIATMMPIYSIYNAMG
ncbi:MAG: type II secretion system F family protein [Chloroflexota bacterium]